MTEIEEDVIDYIISDMEETEKKIQRFVRIDENTLGYTDETIKSILTEDYGLEENTSEYSEHKKAFENAKFIHTQSKTVYGETTYSKYDSERDELYEEQEEWEEEFEYEIKMKKRDPRGVKKGTVRGAYKKEIKNKRFLGCKVTPQEFYELSCIMQGYKKKYNLKTVELIKKIFYEIQKVEKFDFDEFKKQ